MCEGQTLEQTMDEKFTSDVCEDERRGRWKKKRRRKNFQEHFSQHFRASTL
jgi:hypothetical protein